jgi:hypothetical protein
MAVAYQTQKPGQQPAGFELFDISVPEQPKSIAFVDASGPHSRGVHQLWFCDGEYVHMAAGAADFKPRNQLDDQFYRVFDVRNPSKPVEAGRWWMPGTRDGDAEPAPPRHQAPIADMGFRAHNTNVYRRRHVHPRHFRQVEAEADRALGQLAALFRIHAHGAAAVRAQPARGDR